ncbi:cysteine hydrolase family protein [Bosea sp. (in: a-proteobacteria)]|uniref:cysteine hydrolase family protein n=1 Tax=Bosea sp. (in: a-proteobacteria) TaxID=1871050 RepID=UPI002FC93318
MKPLALAHTALIVIDVQKAFEEIAASGVRRNNPQAEAKIAELLAAFRKVGAAIIHIRHASLEPESRLCAGRPGYAVSDVAREQSGEPVLIKHVNSSFIGTDLEARLRGAALSTLVIVGATTNHCVETTTRMAGNLGFDARLVRDAIWTFERTGPDGDHHSAEAIHAMTLSNLSDEFAEIVTADRIIQAVAQAGAETAAKITAEPAAPQPAA